MALTSVVVTKITEKCWLVTGVLAAGASGTIGFSDKTVAADAEIEAPDWHPFQVSSPSKHTVTLAQAVKVTPQYAGAPPAGPFPIDVVKTGTTHADFVATLHNGGANSSGPLEIYVEWAGH